MTMLTDSALAAASSSDAAAGVFWGVVAGGVQLVAVIRTVRLPAPVWSYGRWSKLAAVVAALWLTFNVGVLAVPVGAVAVIWHTRTLGRRSAVAPDVPDLPMAEGTAETRDGEQ